MFIFSNLATSVDGKIATADRALFPLGTPEDRRQMIRLRKRCDAILMGASTLRSFKKPCLVPGKDQQPVNIILSSTLEGISPRWKFFTQKDLKRILFVSHLTPQKRIQTFLQSSEVVLLKKPTPKNPTALQIVRYLEKAGISRLLVEGGGGVMWDFVSYNLIDEYHITLTPKILGGTEAPTLVDGTGFLKKDVLNLKLAQCRIVGDELYLVYRNR